MPSTDFGVPIDPNKPNEFAPRLDSNDDDEASNNSISNKPNGNPVNKLRCWQHTHKLFRNAIEAYNRDGAVKIDENLPIVLCGFSKGCVVLNQLCTELVEVNRLETEAASLLAHDGEREEANSLVQFRARLRHLIWLDGGHSGSSNSWIVDEASVETIKRLKLNCYVYVTPYQMRSQKKWAVDEYERFVALLDKLNVTTRKVYYFQERDDDDVDVDLHFQIIKDFDANLISD